MILSSLTDVATCVCLFCLHVHSEYTALSLPYDGLCADVTEYKFISGTLFCWRGKKNSNV